MKRTLPIIVVGVIIAGACWWCSAVFDLAESSELPSANDSQTATADANEPWSYYADPETGVKLILPHSWFGSFVDAEYSAAELLTIQKELPNFGSMLEEASNLGEKRPLFIAVGRILSDEFTYQPAKLFIYQFLKSSFPLSEDQYFNDIYVKNRHTFLNQYSDEVISDKLVTPSSKIYEFSFCTLMNTDESVCITEYHVITDETVCLLFFSTSQGQGASAQDDFQSIAKQIRCQQ